MGIGMNERMTEAQGDGLPTERWERYWEIRRIKDGADTETDEEEADGWMRLAAALAAPFSTDWSHAIDVQTGQEPVCSSTAGAS